MPCEREKRLHQPLAPQSLETGVLSQPNPCSLTKMQTRFFLPNVPFKIKCIYLVSFKEGPLEELAAIYWEILKRGQGGKKVGCLQQSWMGSPCDLLQDQARVPGAGACPCWTS